MKKFCSMLFLLFVIANFATAQTPMTKTQIDDVIENEMRRTNQVFNWKNASDHMLWSAIVQSDSLVAIGYQPNGFQKLKEQMHTIDVYNPIWTNAREKITTIIDAHLVQNYNNRYSKQYLMPYGEVRKLPYINVRIFDLKLLKVLRQLPEVRYLDPTGYAFRENTGRGTIGCNQYDNAGGINPADFTAISPQSRQSWHQQEHNIQDAWVKSTKGEGIWIAVIDTGCSDTQSKLNADFAEGESAGGSRQVEHYGFYSPNNDGIYDGWEDPCGHGTAMSGLAAAPRGFDDTPAGVAYKANLMTIRGTCDVILDQSNEHEGVAQSLTFAADDPRVKIISMSLGNVTANGMISDAVIYTFNQGKILYVAAGTSSAFTNWFPVTFPANMDEAIAITGVKAAATIEQCNICHDGPEVEFVICMQRDNDNNRTGLTIGIPDLAQDYVSGSSNATATMAGLTALVWGNHPTWTKDQVLQRLRESASFFPNRDNNLGWGKVDASAAVCCPENHNLVGIEGSNVDYETDGDLTSTQIIETNVLADYDALNSIHLLPGFEVVLGATFCAFINGCNNGDGGVNIQTETTKE